MKNRGDPSSPIFYLWENAPAGHPLRSHPNVVPFIRPIVTTTTTTEQMVTLTLAAAIAVGADKHGVDFPLFIQNAATGKWGPSGPQTSGLDSLSSPSPHTPTPSQSSMFVANGIADVSARMTTWFGAVRDAFNAAGIPAPRAAFWDDEEVAGFGVGGAFVEDAIVGRTVAIATDTGSWVPSLADARAGSQSVCPGLRNGDANLTLTAWNAARIAASVTYDGTKSSFSIENTAFRNWMRRYARYSWILNQCVYAPARATWPGIETGNYNDYCADGAKPLAESFNARFAASAARNFASVHVPVLYQPQLANLAAAGLAQYGDDKSTELRQFIRTGRTACSMATDATERAKPVIPWLQAPGLPITAHDAYVPTVDDMVSVMVWMCRTFGDSRFAIFNAPNYTSWDDLLVCVNATLSKLRRPFRSGRLVGGRVPKWRSNQWL